MKKLLEALDLPQEVKTGIKSRSAVLGSTLKTLTEDDLIQEGLCLVYSIKKEKPDVPLLYLMKAINNHYSSIQKHEIRYKKTFASLSSHNVEKTLDTKAYKAFQKDVKPRIAANIDATLPCGDVRLNAAMLLKTEGHSLKDIAAYLGKDVKTVRRLLHKHGRHLTKNEKD
jgi:DNA-directed RNA polymerase specialized sigma24 family protein